VERVIEGLAALCRWATSEEELGGGQVDATASYLDVHA
jgi:hypothetical protein